MFRISRILPALKQRPHRSLHVYRPLLSSYPRYLISQNGPLNVQHVRIKHPPRFKRLLSTAFRRLAYVGLFSVVFATILFDDEEDEEPVEEAKEGERQTTSEGSEGSEANEEDTIFIPLGFAYKLPRKFYKGTDPEWQSFIQLSRDKKRCEFLKNELAGRVGQFVGSMPPFKNALGENNKPRKFWIDQDFPDGPPPQYERKGIEIGADHISWTTRSVHPIHYAWIQKALWPTSLASSFWASSKTITSLQYSKLKSVLDFTSDARTSDSKDSKSPDIKVQQLSQQTNPQEQQSAPASNSDMPAGSPTFNSASSQSSTPYGSSDLSKLLPVLPTLPGVDDDMGTAVDAFKKTFARTWRPVRAPAEPGSVRFSGLVELVGPKGIAVLDVLALYHVAEARWISISIAIRRVQYRKQSPRGGA